jgi:hypothetical protein
VLCVGLFRHPWNGGVWRYVEDCDLQKNKSHMQVARTPENYVRGSTSLTPKPIIGLDYKPFHILLSSKIHFNNFF